MNVIIAFTALVIFILSSSDKGLNGKSNPDVCDTHTVLYLNGFESLFRPEFCRPFLLLLKQC